MSWSWEWVVEVRATSSGKEVSLGSGALIAPNRILTACHVVFDNGEVVPGIRVRLEGRSESVPASVVWRSDDDTDVAVLEANLTHDKLGSVLALLSDRTIAAGERWEAKGFPEVSQKKPSCEAHKYGDTTLSWDPSEKCLVLKEFATPDSWCGLSGAAVIINGHIVGVVRSYERNHDGKRLRATPVAHFVHVPGFREALGLTEQDDQLEQRIQRMVDDVAEVLVKRPQLLDVFTKRLKLQSAPDERARVVAYALVRQRKASEIAKDFNHADADLAKNEQAKDDRAALCKILFRILPLAIDWHKLVLIALRDFPDRRTSLRNFIELPLRTETIAEIVLSGIDDRSCQLELPDHKKMPVGAGVVRVPAAVRTALIDVDGSHFAESVVQDLATKFGIEQHKHYNDLRDAVAAHLQYHTCDAPDDELVPYYLLFVDGDDGTDDKLFTLARTKLADELPPLRLVRLTGTNLKDENSFAHHIQGMLKRR